MSTTLIIILVFSLPIVGAIIAFASDWLKFRARQKELGASSQELEQKVAKLERTNAEYAQRLENLEAIVVSQTWNALQEPGLSEAERQRRIIAAGVHEAPAPAVEERNRQRAADLARRFGG